MVSERLADLERELGARLVQRTTRKMSLTEDGCAFLSRTRRILQEAQDGRDELAQQRGELIGPLRPSRRRKRSSMPPPPSCCYEGWHVEKAFETDS